MPIDGVLTARPPRRKLLSASPAPVAAADLAGHVVAAPALQRLPRAARAALRAEHGTYVLRLRDEPHLVVLAGAVPVSCCMVVAELGATPVAAHLRLRLAAGVKSWATQVLAVRALSQGGVVLGLHKPAELGQRDLIVNETLLDLPAGGRSGLLATSRQAATGACSAHRADKLEDTTVLNAGAQEARSAGLAAAVVRLPARGDLEALVQVLIFKAHQAQEGLALVAAVHPSEGLVHPPLKAVEEVRNTLLQVKSDGPPESPWRRPPGLQVVGFRHGVRLPDEVGPLAAASLRPASER
mmetsp:Transcript_85847/g.255965  ORF Transcript_85847/g.255965 Transcript_85847/m.255965 type:complete len:297 (+) Transcript_85847:655-1545(+)